MGIGVDVEGFYHMPSGGPFEGNTSVRRAYLQRRSEMLGLICAHFGWQSAPWGEPNEQADGDGNSMQWASYTALLKLAHAVAAQAAESGECLFFLHLTRRYDSGEQAIYLPVEFAEPFLIERNEYPEKSTVGSSVHLLTELAQLDRIVADPSNPWFASAEHYDRVSWAHARMSEGAHHSVELQLPLFLSW